MHTQAGSVLEAGALLLGAFVAAGLLRKWGRGEAEIHFSTIIVALLAMGGGAGTASIFIHEMTNWSEPVMMGMSGGIGMLLGFLAGYIAWPEEPSESAVAKDSDKLDTTLEEEEPVSPSVLAGQGIYGPAVGQRWPNCGKK